MTMVIVLNKVPRGMNLFHLMHTFHRHPDMTRQRSRWLRSKALQAARVLKYAPVGRAPEPPRRHARGSVGLRREEAQSADRS
jgi:hypothetical protein